MRIETERLLITDFQADMAEAVHRNSLDEDNRRFVPDEVFETVEEAREVVTFLMGQYGGTEGPFVHPILLKSGENIGYVQLVKLPEGWELGYHVAQEYTSRGYATEAVRAFLPVMAETKELLRNSKKEIFAVENCGMETEKLYRSLEEIPDDAGYLSLLIAKDPAGKDHAAS